MTRNDILEHLCDSDLDCLSDNEFDGYEDDVAEELANHQGGNGLSAKRLCPNSDVRLDQFCHFPCAINGLGQRCKMEGCKRQSCIKCKKCDVFLCLTNKRNCFKAFHVKLLVNKSESPHNIVTSL